MSRRSCEALSQVETARTTPRTDVGADASPASAFTALASYLRRGLERDGFGGLWNSALKCTCVRDRPMPCNEARCDCVLVYWWRCQGCPEASADGSGCEYEGGGISFAPTSGCLRDGPQW